MFEIEVPCHTVNPIVKKQGSVFGGVSATHSIIHHPGGDSLLPNPATPATPVMPEPGTTTTTTTVEGDETITTTSLVNNDGTTTVTVVKETRITLADGTVDTSSTTTASTIPTVPLTPAVTPAAAEQPAEIETAKKKTNSKLARKLGVGVGDLTGEGGRIGFADLLYALTLRHYVHVSINDPEIHAKLMKKRRFQAHDGTKEIFTTKHHAAARMVQNTWRRHVVMKRIMGTRQNTAAKMSEVKKDIKNLFGGLDATKGKKAKSK